MAESDNSVSERRTAAGDAAAADNHCAPAEAARADVRRELLTPWAWVLGFAAALVGWIQLGPRSGMALRVPVAAATVLAPFAAFLISFPAALRLWRRHDGSRPPERRRRLASAFGLGLAFALFTCAQCAWYCYQLLGRQPPFPSCADIGYLLAYPCLIAGVLSLPSRRLPALLRGRVLMDSVMTIAAAATFSWYFIVGPVLLAPGGSALGKLVSSAYPVADLLLLFGLLLTMARARGVAPPRGLMPLCMGLLVAIVSDVVFGYQGLHGAYVPWSMLDAGWPLAHLLLGVGSAQLLLAGPGAAGAERTSPDDAVASGIAALLPYALVPLVGALVLGTLYEPSGMLVVGVYVGSALIVVLVALRQVLAIRQNARLYAEVSRAYAQLEQSHHSLEAANGALARSEERFRAAAESASDLVFEYDAETGRIEWFGDVDGKLGHRPGAFPRTARAWQEAIHPEDCERVRSMLDRHVKTREPFDAEYRVRRADGEYRHWVGRGRAVARGGGGASVRTVGVVSDVTERKRAEALEGERAALRQAVSAMEGVLGVVGHELRTPLAGLRAMSEFLLTDGAVQGADCRQMLGGINEEVVRMAETVNDLLEAARLNSGLAKWKWSRFDLAPACRDALETVRPLVDQSRVALECDVEPDCAMRGDADAVRRLVLNLVGNARKFTAAGSIRVGARTTIDGGRQWTEISVADTGAGIPAEIRDRLGEAFALNAGLVGANHVSGTGLGLAICKGIALAHGGALAIRSELGKGTTVVARLRADLPGAVTEQGKSSVAIAGVAA